MAKRSQRRSVRCEKDRAGCMWGFIRIFDFHRGRATQRLLSHRRHGSKQAASAGYSRSKLNLPTDFDENLYDVKESETASADTDNLSVNKLMEDDILSEKEDMKKQMSNAEGEPKESCSKCRERVKKSCRRTKKDTKNSCDIHLCEVNAAENLGPETFFHQISELKTSSNSDMEVIVEEICHQIHLQNVSPVKNDWHSDLDMQSDKTCSVFEEKLGEALKVFVNQKFTNRQCLKEDRNFCNSNEFMDALQTLCSNRELFLKLLKDPNSLLVRHIRNLEDTLLEKDEHSKSVVRRDLIAEGPSNSRPSELVNQKKHTFFRKRSKSQESNPLNGTQNCQPSDRIIILKPGPTSLQNSERDGNLCLSLQSCHSLSDKVQNERIASQFSFTEIKRKLKHAIGKERHGISANTFTHEFPCEHRNVGSCDKGISKESGGWHASNRNRFYNERFARPSIGITKVEKTSSPKDTKTGMENETIRYPEERVSNIYIEAKKHLLEMLSSGDEIEDFSSRQLPETLGRVLSLHEFDLSPICSPGRDAEHGFVTAQMSPCNSSQISENTLKLIHENHVENFSPSVQNFESRSHFTDANPGDRVQSPNSNLSFSDGLNRVNAVVEASPSLKDEIISEGDVEIVNTTDTVFLEESEVLDVSLKNSAITINDEKGDTSEADEEDETSQCLILDSCTDDETLSAPLASSPSFSITKGVEDLESTNEGPEQPSPVSVLEPLFTEDEISPAGTKSQHVERAIEPQQIHFEDLVFSAMDQQGLCVRTCMEDEESTFEYVEAVLLGSGLNWDDFLSKWLSSGQLLDLSLFHDVELFSNRPHHDQKLLFDCTSAVLKEVCEHYFGYIKQNIRPVPKGMNLISEVWKGVEWHLLTDSSPRTLDQIVKKDMEKAESWMDLRFDTKSIGIETGEAIFEELIEDSILSFVNQGPKCDLSAASTELKEEETTMNLQNENFIRSTQPQTISGRE